jgi:hypothetical protein
MLTDAKNIEGNRVPDVTFKTRANEPVVKFSKPGCPHCARARRREPAPTQQVK